MAIIQGTAGPDVMVGTPDPDEMFGGDGNDRLNASAGNDKIYGGNGNDTLTGDAGADELHGGDGNDGFFGGGSDDVVYGDAGTDTMYGDDGNDRLYGGDQNDTLFGGNSNDFLYGGNEVDNLIGGAGDDHVEGGMGNDLINGGIGNDFIVYRVGEGTDVMNGGTGRDTLQIEMTSAQMTSAIVEELKLIATWLESSGVADDPAAENTNPVLSLPNLDFTIGGVETVRLLVDGAEVALGSLFNAAPVVAPLAEVETAEDTPVSGSVVASDPDADALSWTLAGAPSNGTVFLDANTGNYVYTPSQNFSGTDSFLVDVRDPAGEVSRQQVTVAVGAAADAPLLQVADVALAGSVELVGTSSADTLTGGAGDDSIGGGDGNDVLRGDGGPLTQTFALGIDAALTDTDGSERLSVTIAGLPDDAVLSAGTSVAAGTWVLQQDELAGLMLTALVAGDLELQVTATSREADGSTATTSATLTVSADVGKGGNDRIDGGVGHDAIHGEQGNDTLIDGAGDDQVYGGGGDDMMIAGAGNDVYDGGDGFDTIDFSESGSVNVDLGSSKTGFGTDKFSGVEGVIGTAGNDQIKGSAAANDLFGGDGNDKLNGVVGDDALHGGAGDDDMQGGSGNDTLNDGADNDKVYGGEGDDMVFAGTGSDNFYGGAGFDTIDFSASARGLTMDLGKGKVSGEGNDRISSFEKVIGTDFADSFTGSTRADAIDGGAGNDVVRGGRGSDVLTGGEGTDTFVWKISDVVSLLAKAGVDTITDFEAGDRLDLRDVTKGNLLPGASVKVTDGDQGSMVSVKIGLGYVDVVRLDGVHGLTAADLLADGSILA